MRHRSTLEVSKGVGEVAVTCGDILTRTGVDAIP